MNNVFVAVAGLALWTRERLFGRRIGDREYLFGIYLVNGYEGYCEWLYRSRRRHREPVTWDECVRDASYFSYIVELVEEIHPGFDRPSTGNLLINGIENDITGMMKSFLR